MGFRSCGLMGNLNISLFCKQGPSAQHPLDLILYCRPCSGLQQGNQGNAPFHFLNNPAAKAEVPTAWSWILGPRLPVSRLKSFDMMQPFSFSKCFPWVALCAGKPWKEACRLGSSALKFVSKKIVAIYAPKVHMTFVICLGKDIFEIKKGDLVSLSEMTCTH